MSILQTKLRHCKRHEASRVGLSTMPLDQYIAGGHGAREPRLTSLPHARHPLLARADKRAQREPRLHQPPVLPRAALTHFAVGRIALRGMEARLTQDEHLFFAWANQPLQGVIGAMGRGTRPPHDQPPRMEPQTALAPAHPAMIGEALAAERLRAAALAPGVDQRDAVGVDDAEPGRRGQEDRRPGLRRPEAAQKAGPLGELGEQRARVARQPAREGPVADPLERL
jgi:hypothetical protein